jgi:hypothetical protein
VEIVGLSLDCYQLANVSVCRPVCLLISGLSVCLCVNVCDCACRPWLCGFMCLSLWVVSICK